MSSRRTTTRRNSINNRGASTDALTSRSLSSRSDLDSINGNASRRNKPKEWDKLTHHGFAKKWKKAKDAVGKDKWLGNLAGMVILLVGLAISIPVLFILRKNAQQVARQPFVSDCQSTVEAVRSRLMVPLTVLYGYRWLFDSGLPVTLPTFQSFSTSFRTQSWMVPWVGYASYINSTNRPEWEKIHNRTIFQSPLTDSGRSEPLSDRDFAPVPRGAAESYFPTEFVPRGSEWMIGFDVLSDSVAQQSTFQAINTGGLSIGTRVGLSFGFNDTNLEDSHWFFLPWYGPNLTSQTVQGIFFGLFVAEKMIDEVVQSTTANISMGFNILDASGGNRVIYTHPKNATPSGNAMGYYNLPVANRQWTLYCWGTPTNVPSPYVAFVSLLLLFTVTSLLTRCLLLRHHNDPTDPPPKVIENPRMSERQIDWMRDNAYSILGALRDPLLLINREGYVIDANDEGLATIGYGVEDLITGVHIARVFPGVRIKKKRLRGKEGRRGNSSPSGSGTGEDIAIDIDSTVHDLTDLPNAENTNNSPGMVVPGLVETPLHAKSGTITTVQANFSPIIDSDENREKIQMVLFRDISQFKQGVKEAVEAKEQAEGANTEKSNFLAFVCHELRNPLHAVIGLTSLLLQSIQTALEQRESTPQAASTTSSLDRSPPPAGQTTLLSPHTTLTNFHQTHEETLDHLHSITDASKAMKTILNDIRLLSKLENGQIEFEYSAFDLKVLLERLYRTQVGCYEPNLAGKEAPGGSDEEVDVGRDVKFYMVLNGLDSLSGGGGEDQWTLLNPTKEYFPKKLKGDATRLLVILNHTISNAFENTEHGSVTLRVCVERVRDLNQRDVDGEIVTPGGRKAVKNGEGGKKQVLVTFEVEDTGKELTSEEMQRLFKGYSQGSAAQTTTPAILSLNIIYSLLSLMGSEMRATSSPHGTKIWFSLWFDMIRDDSPNEDFPNVELKGLGLGDLFGRRESVRRGGSILEKEREERGRERERDKDGEDGDMRIEKEKRQVKEDGNGTGNDPIKSNDHDLTPLPTAIQISLRTATPPKPIPNRRTSATPPSAGKTSTPPRPPRSNQQKSPSSNGNKKRLGTHPLHSRPIRVLVVEDNEILLKIAATTLSRVGFEVQTATNGEESIKRIVEMGDKFFDVCLMDLLMPIMDGFAATEEIRRRGWTLPVIALTAKTLESDRLRCYKIGFNYFMTKPFQLGDIATIIRFMVGAEAEQQASGGEAHYGSIWSKFS